MQDIKKNFPSTVLMLVILIIGSVYLFEDSMSKYPSYLHAWTQSDRLALAQNFQDNGFDFFHPATFNLLTKDGVTQVDFPIHDYLVAVIGKIFNADLVFTFRLYNLIYSLIGLFFLFSLCLIAGLSGIRSILLTSFFFTLPFYVYYQNGFLPSTASLSNLLIGLFFLYKFFKNSKSKVLVISAIFLSISALARLPFSIFLFASILLIYWKQFKSKKWQLLEGLPLILGLVAVILYQLYNNHLGEVYGSMFLQEFLYVDGVENLIHIINTAAERWSNDLLSPFHAVLFIGLLSASLWQFYKNQNAITHSKSLIEWFSISSIGVLLYFFLMGNQFIDHDYYYIDSLLPLFMIIGIICFRYVRISKSWYTPIASICLIFFFYFFSYASQIQTERYTPEWNDRVEYGYSVYSNSKNDFKKWGLKESDTLTVLDANSTNIPFTVYRTKGYTSLNSMEDSVLAALKKQTNYVALIDSFFRTDTYRDYPEIINELELVNTNEQISLYRIDKEDDGPKDFFDNYIFNADFDFDNTRPNYDFYNGFTNQVEKDGNKSLQINPENAFNLTFSDTIMKLNLNKPLRIIVVADYFQADTISKIQLVCQFGNYYKAHYTQNTLTEIDSVVNKTYKWAIPAEKLKENQQIKIYYWNQDKLKVNIDNYHLLIYQ